MSKQLTTALSFALTMLLSISSYATAMYTTYQAKIIKPDGTPLESTSVNFRFTILDPLGSCILYTENFNTINMSGSGGLVYFSLGSGIKTFPTSGTVNFSDVFSNQSAALSCAAGGPPSYTPADNDLRKIVMQFHDGSGWQTLPAMAINHVPYAMYANSAASATTAVNSTQLNGKTDLDFVQVTSIPTCSASQALQFNGASFGCVNVGSSGGNVTSVSGSAGEITSSGGSTPTLGLADAGTAGTYYRVITDSKGRITSGVTTLSLSDLPNTVLNTTSNFAGDITGIISNITVNRIQGVSVTVTSLTANDILHYDGSKYINKNIPTCSGSQYLTFNGTSFSCTADAGATSAAIIATLGYTPAYASSATQWITNGSDIYYNTGNVGVGNANPSAAVDVVKSGAGSYTGLKSNISSTTGNATGVDTYANGSNYSTGVLVETESNGATVGVDVYASVSSVSGSYVRGINVGIDDSLVAGSGLRLFADTVTTKASKAIEISQGFNAGYAIYANTNGKSYFKGDVGIGTSTPVTKLDVSGGVRIGTESTACAPALAGTLRYNATNVEYCNGTSWQAFGVSGSGITNFNGSTSGTQSFATGTGGTAPNFNTSNGVHTLNIPLASAGSVTAGLLSNADYSTFMNKITSSAASIAQALGYIPASSTALGNYLMKANNLSDLASSATARANLGLGGFATINSLDLSTASATGIIADARLMNFSDVTSGTQYTKITVDGKGRVTSGAQLSASDVATALGYTPQASGAVSSQWTTSGTTIHYVTGNVGIGTTGPSALLHVNGVISDTAEAFKITDSSAAGSFLKILDGTSIGGQMIPMIWGKGVGTGSVDRAGLYFIGEPGQDNANSPAIIFDGRRNAGAISNSPLVSFRSNTVERVVFMPSGNVGIGTTTPTTTLVVSGVATFIKNASGGSFDSTIISKAPNGQLQFGSHGSVNKIVPANLAGSAAQTLYLEGPVADSIPQIYMRTEDLTVTGTNPVVNVGTSRVHSNGSSYLMGGNVGVGTAAPSRTLEVSGSTQLKGYLFVGNAPSSWSGNPIVGNGNASRGSLTLLHSTVSQSQTSNGLDLSLVFSNAELNLRENGYMRLMTNNSERMRIDATGNVGIGTTAPATKLSVSGGVQIGMESATCATSYAGTLRYNAGNVQFCNGTTWSSFGVAGSEITNFNGSTSGTQSFATGTGGTAPNFNTSNGVHTLNIPLASAGSVTAGLLSNADYSTFMNKITSSAASIAQVLGYVPASSTALGNYLMKANNLSDLASSATARTNLGLGGFATVSSLDLSTASATGILSIARLPSFAGDVTSVSGSNSLTVDGLQGRSVASTAPTSGQVLAYNGSSWAPFSVGSSQWNTSGTTINYTAGNVGVGTAGPLNLLHLHASAGNTVFRMSNASTGTTGADGFVIQQTATDVNLVNYEAGAMGFQTSASERMRITSAGAVGIGTTAPSEALEVAGSVKAISFITSSDRRLKENIQTSKGLDLILNLRGVSYNWKRDGKKEYGLIAQEVEEVLPELVVTDQISGMKGVRYQSLVSPLIEATKELYYRCEDQKKLVNTELEYLKKKNDRLEEQVGELKEKLEEIERYLKLSKKQKRATASE